MRFVCWLLVGLSLFAPEIGKAETENNPKDGIKRDPLTISVVVRHRVVPDFSDTIQATWGMGDLYWIGDSEYSLEILCFVSDFGINEEGDIIERSPEAHNPACQVVIYKDEIEDDKIWSFFGTGAPHFRRESILSVDIVSFPWKGVVLSEPIPREAK